MRYSLWLFLTLLLPFLFWFSSCSKDGNCLTNTGPVIMQHRDVADFDTIAMYDYVNVILTQDSLNQVTVETGQNIISGISTEVMNRILIIRNNNVCNWLRSYNKPINVYVHVKNLRSIYYKSSGDVTTTNTIITPLLKFVGLGGCGTIDIRMKAYEGFFIQGLGTTDIHLHGMCDICSVYAGDYGPIQCGDLQTIYSYTKNYGSNDCYVKASHFLDATIGSIGNIYYIGDPDTLQTHISGTGSVIRIGK